MDEGGEEKVDLLVDEVEGAEVVEGREEEG